MVLLVHDQMIYFSPQYILVPIMLYDSIIDLG